MQIIDIVLGALLLFGLVRGFSKGLFVEIASLGALIAAVYGAIHFSYFVGDYLKEQVSWDEKYSTIVAFAITFVVIVFVVSLAGKVLTKLASFASLGFLNKFLGGVFGALKIGLILSIVLVIFSRLNSTIPFTSEETLNSSILYRPVQSLAPWLIPSIVNATNEVELPFYQPPNEE